MTSYIGLRFVSFLRTSWGPFLFQKEEPESEGLTPDGNMTLVDDIGEEMMLLFFVVGVGGVGGYLYIKMRGGKLASKTVKPDPDADYHDEDEEALEFPEESDEDDDGVDDDTDVNEDYEAETDDEPV